jgi:putative spermidine/putrescine transport system ATP-binding protein
LQREVGISFVFVTHDQEEAMALSDRVALLRSGELEQVATPRQIYNRPATAYTARFIGQTNLLRGRIEHGVAECGILKWRCGGPSAPATFSLRPESIRLCDVAAAGNRESVRFHAMVRSQTFGGATDLLETVCPDGRSILVRVASRGNIQGDCEFEFCPEDAILVRD